MPVSTKIKSKGYVSDGSSNYVSTDYVPLANTILVVRASLIKTAVLEMLAGTVSLAPLNSFYVGRTAANQYLLGWGNKSLNSTIQADDDIHTFILYDNKLWVLNEDVNVDSASAIKKIIADETPTIASDGVWAGTSLTMNIACRNLDGNPSYLINSSIFSAKIYEYAGANVVIKRDYLLNNNQTVFEDIEKTRLFWEGTAPLTGTTAADKVLTQAMLLIDSEAGNRPFFTLASNSRNSLIDEGTGKFKKGGYGSGLIVRPSTGYNLSFDESTLKNGGFKFNNSNSVINVKDDKDLLFSANGDFRWRVLYEVNNLTSNQCIIQRGRFENDGVTTDNTYFSYILFLNSLGEMVFSDRMSTGGISVRVDAVLGLNLIEFGRKDGVMYVTCNLLTDSAVNTNTLDNSYSNVQFGLIYVNNQIFYPCSGVIYHAAYYDYVDSIPLCLSPSLPAKAPRYREGLELNTFDKTSLTNVGLPITAVRDGISHTAGSVTGDWKATNISGLGASNSGEIIFPCTGIAGVYSQLTLEYYFRFDATTGQVWLFNVSTVEAGTSSVFALRVRNTGEVVVEDDTGTNYTGAVLSAGEWNHLAVSYDSGEFRFYLNGKLKLAQATGASTYAVAGTDVFKITNYTDADTNPDCIAILPNFAYSDNFLPPARNSNL